MNLYTNIRAKSISYGGSRTSSSIIYPVIHFTANRNSKPINEAKYFRDTNNRAAGAPSASYTFKQDSTYYPNSLGVFEIAD